MLHACVWTFDVTDSVQTFLELNTFLIRTYTYVPFVLTPFILFKNLHKISLFCYGLLLSIEDLQEWLKFDNVCTIFFWIKRVVKRRVKKVKRTTIWNGGSSYYPKRTMLIVERATPPLWSSLYGIVCNLSNWRIFSKFCFLSPTCIACPWKLF